MLITCNAVGDILALATLVLDVIRALNDAKGSASEYRVFVDELNGLRTILAAAARVAQDNVDGALREQLIREVDQCGRNAQDALARVVDFSAMTLLIPYNAVSVIRARQEESKTIYSMPERSCYDDREAPLVFST